MQPTRSLTNSVPSITSVLKIKTLMEKEYKTYNVFGFSLQVLFETPVLLWYTVTEM
jgi:hypothetical protein